MHVGTITKLFQVKEYGRIRSTGGEEVHFHKHCLWNTEFKELAEGQEVEFEMQASHKGFLAFHIRPTVKNVSL